MTKDNTLALSGTVSDATSGVASVQILDGVTVLGTATVVSGNWSFTTAALTDGAHSFTAKATDNAGNTFTTSPAVTATVDTTAPTVTSFTEIKAGNNRTFTLVVTDATSGVSASIPLVDTTQSNLALGSAALSSGTANSGAWTLGLTNSTAPAGGAVKKSDTVSATVTDAAGNAITPTMTVLDPAGIAGSPINLALAGPSGTGAMTAITISGMPSDWGLNAGINNGDGSWTVETSDPSSLYMTTAAGFAGAMVLNVSMSWTNADGSTGSAFVADNVEAYPASPIFAVSGDDTLTGSSGNDEFVFAQPIGDDRVYDFNAASDTLDLIGFGIAGFADLQGSIANDAGGNAVVTLGGGGTITLVGVDAGALSAGNFVFDAEPVSADAGTMTVSDGAILPIGGTIDNTGTIAVNSTGDETDLEILVRGATLTGGGHLTLSDDGANVVFGGDPSAVLTNVDNIISGAGQLGDGSLTLDNQRIIDANGANALVIDTGANAVVNTGTLMASGAGGLVVQSAVTGGGAAEIDGSSSLEFAAASDAQVSFDAGASGTLKLDQSGGFTGTIAGFTGYDAIDLADIVEGQNATLGYAGSADNSGGILTVGDGTHIASLALLGQYAATSDFAVASDGHGGTLVSLADPTQSHLAIPH